MWLINKEERIYGVVEDFNLPPDRLPYNTNIL